MDLKELLKDKDIEVDVTLTLEDNQPMLYIKEMNSPCFEYVVNNMADISQAIDDFIDSSF